MKRFRNFSSGLITFLIVYFVFFTMNDLVAQLIFYFGLAIIGKYIFRLVKMLVGKIVSFKLCDCGFWDENWDYKSDIRLIEFSKEDGQNE